MGRTAPRIGCAIILIALITVGAGVIGGIAIAGRFPECTTNMPDALAMRFTLLARGQSLNAPAGNNATPVKLTVRVNESIADIGTDLASQGLVADAETFTSYAHFCGIGSKFQAGTYLLNQTQTIPQIAEALTNAGANQIALHVLEGWRIEQIAEAIDHTPGLGFQGSDFLALVGPGAQPPDWFTQATTLPSGASLEGFLFPDTYELSLNATASDLRDQMLYNFLQRVTPQMRADVSVQGLTLYQAITLASIVEREAVVDEERPLIASVYLNRLRKPMTLDADPTIQYALGISRVPGNWWPPLTVDDYRNVDSPYNTYLHQGFPPSPIANPGLASIQAAIYPRQSPYFFFRADCAGDGHHKFAITFAEQQANGC